MAAAAAAWAEATEAEETERYDLSPQAEAACKKHGIDFGALVRAAARRLQDEIEEADGLPAFSDGQSWRRCAIEVLIATHLAEDKAIERALEAVAVAEATEDADLIEAAQAHYDRLVVDLLRADGLAPVVEALRDQIFRVGDDLS